MQTHSGEIVIVGGGFAGIEVARALAGSSAEVTLIDRNNYTLFQPLLYQVATAALSPAEVAWPIRALISAANVQILLDTVCEVDLERARVATLSGRALRYSALVLAPGSQYDYYGHEDWRALALAPKTLEDAIAIRRRLLLAFEHAEGSQDPAERAALMTFVIVGGGPTGVEMAGAVAELARATLVRDFRHIDTASAQILLIEAGAHILGGFTPSLGSYAQSALERLGVQVLLQTPIESIDARGVIAGGRRIEARTVIWGAGVRAAPVASWLHVPAGARGTIQVEADFSLPRHPEVFVIGDAAEVQGEDGRPLPGLAAVAKQQGQYLGRLLRCRLEGRPAPGRFHYRDYGTMATIGRSAAVARLRGWKLTGHFAWLTWGAVHLYFLIGIRNRLLVLVNWLWAWLTYGRGARLITGIESPPPSN